MFFFSEFLSPRNSQPIPTPRNYSIFFEWTYANIDQDIQISPFSEELATHSCSEELSNPFSGELAQLSTRIFEPPLELDLLKKSKDTQLTKKKLGTGISRRQKRIPFPRPIPLRANCLTTGRSNCCRIATNWTEVAVAAGRAPANFFLSFPPCLSFRSPSVVLSHCHYSASRIQVSTPSTGSPDPKRYIFPFPLSFLPLFPCPLALPPLSAACDFIRIS